LTPVELERRDFCQFAQPGVEGRRALDPFPVDLELGVRVPVERIADLLLQPLRGEVVAHIGKARARGDAGDARHGCEHRRFPDTKAFAGMQHAARAEFGRIQKIDIRVVVDRIAHGAVERDGFLLCGARFADRPLGEGPYGRIAAIDKGRGVQIISIVHRQFVRRRSLPPFRRPHTCWPPLM
jgi:hypothetical protein